MSDLNEFVISDREIDFLKPLPEDEPKLQLENLIEPLDNLQPLPILQHISVTSSSDKMENKHQSIDVEGNMKGSDGFNQGDASVADSNRRGTEFFNVETNQKQSVGEILETIKSSKGFDNDAWGNSPSMHNSVFD